MKRVAILANNLQQASFRERMSWLPEKLRDRGIEATVLLRPKGWLDRRKLFRSMDAYDVVLVQRKFLDPSDARLLRRHARRIVYDIDDALMHFNRPVGMVSRWRTQRRFLATARAVDHVVAGNEYLADIFRKQGCAASVQPNVVDPAQYIVRSHEPTETPTLVWIGSKSTLPYLQGCIALIEAAARVVPGLNLRVIADQTLSGTGLNVEFVPWSIETFARTLGSSDIGISPMPEDPWTLGKCAFKILQYMAAGLPVIASPVGANAEMVRENVTGFLPRSDEQWTEAIVKLARDVEMRRRMGGAARELVEGEYTMDRAADAWAAILTAVGKQIAPDPI